MILTVLTAQLAFKINVEILALENVEKEQYVKLSHTKQNVFALRIQDLHGQRMNAYFRVSYVFLLYEVKERV